MNSNSFNGVTNSKDWGARGGAAVNFAADLVFDHVSHRFGSHDVLQDVSLGIEPGEIMCLLGESGCGKTTLLRIAAGIERPTSGRLVMNGKELVGPNSFVPPEDRGIGLVFQDYALFPHLSVLKNVMFGLRGLPKKDAQSAATNALERVGLAHYGQKYPHMLSGGQQQRVALARALAPRPSILLLDEPFSGLDTGLRDRIRTETLAILRETKTTSILVTHDPEEAMGSADRIALLRNGHLIQVGTPDVLYRAPNDRETAQFFGFMNKVSGAVRNGHVETPVGAFAANGFQEGEEVDVCIRPQGVIPNLHGDGIPGRIVSRQFLGEVDLYEVAVQGHDQLLLSRMPAHSSLGDPNVCVRFVDELVLVFSRKQSAREASAAQ